MSAVLAGADWRTATLPMLAERDLARWMGAGGAKVVEGDGRYWQEVVPGFFQPLHYLARFAASELVPPTRLCWGMRAVLAEADAAAANVATPVHVLPDLAGYGPGRLDRRRRQALAKAERHVEVVVLERPDMVLEQGYPLALEAATRNARNRPPPQANFSAWVKAAFDRPGPIVLAALDGDRLLGFSLSFAIDGVAYGHKAFIGDAGRRHCLDLLCFHVEALIAQRTPGIHTLVNGLHAPENEGLCTFKRRQGLIVAEFPSLTTMHPIAGSVLRYLRPHQFYRLTGRK
jgi:hypothetical protein